MAKLTEQEQARVEELQQIGFEVVGTGINGMNSSGKSYGICYWRYMRGNRVSALQPSQEAAWRDAIREWDGTLKRVQLDEAQRQQRKLNPSEQNILKGLEGREYRAAQSQLEQMISKMISAGLTIDVRKMQETYVSLSVEPLPIDAMKNTLESAGYTFAFTAAVGWRCMTEGVKGTGSLETAVKSAWKHALDKGISEQTLTSVCLAYAEPEKVTAQFVGGLLKPEEKIEILTKVWDGTGNPPVGTTCWVTPHNTIWGFHSTAPHLCQVLAYRDEYVWLELLSDVGETTYTFTTTRTDKVDFKVWKGNNKGKPDEPN